MASSCSHFLLLLLPILCLAKKNILFLAADDLRPNLGLYPDVYQEAVMHTPNLDGLASRSLVFERAYVQQALCSPSRSSLMTGRRPDTTHVTDLNTWFREAGGNFTTIPQFFKQQGYKSINVGKMFHPSEEASGPGGKDKL